VWLNISLRLYLTIQWLGTWRLLGGCIGKSDIPKSSTPFRSSAFTAIWRSVLLSTSYRPQGYSTCFLTSSLFAAAYNRLFPQLALKGTLTINYIHKLTKQHEVAQLVEALYYKLQGRGFKFRWGGFFQLT
jgi:hypothetical protein